MKFMRADVTSATRALTAQLDRLLGEGKHVLWLVSGGSNIPITVQVMAAIPSNLTQRLTIMPADERYGAPGHADSNMQQLHDQGFNPKQATVVPILTGEPLAVTSRQYASSVETHFANSDVIVAQLGVGTDGHIAGILPDSAAARTDAGLTIGYETTGFNRLTLTFPALRSIDTAYVFAYGANKRAALMQLRSEAVPLTTQPAQILKAIPEVYVYNDQLE